MVLLDTDFKSLTTSEQIRHFEVEGFVILPEIVSPEQVATIKEELSTLPMRESFYSDKPTFGAAPPQWHSQAVGELIGNPAAVAFLHALLGDEVLFIHGHYILSHPGHPALELHSDYKPFGSTYARWEESGPASVRFLYYLDDTSTDRGALRIVPRSHICWHEDAHPYHRYVSHPEEVLVPMRAGSALAFAMRLFHGTAANTATSTRGMLEMDYRPVWARPVMPVEEWDEAAVAAAPAVAHPLLRSKNIYDRSWEFMKQNEILESQAMGMAPSRWGANRPRE